MVKKLLRKVKKIFKKQKKHDKSIDFMDLGTEEFTAWWGNLTLEEEQSRYLKIDQLVICIDRLQQEWCIAINKEQDPQYPKKTLCLQNKSSEILIKPILADRNLLSPLKYPLYIPGESEITLYACSPVFIQVCVKDSPLAEIPTQILPDSWQGSTLIGELCYGGSPVCFKLEELLINPTQVITPVTIMNHDKETISLKEITIPLPTLSIYHDSQNHLWTEHLLISNISSFLSTNLLKNKESGLPDNLTLLAPPRWMVKPRFRGFLSNLKIK